MAKSRLKKLLIVGGGTAGWSAAAALSRVAQHSGVEIVLLESEQIGTVGVGEATVPTIKDFHFLIQLDEGQFLRETNATMKYGIEFRDWLRQGHSYFHPFGHFGANFGPIPFHHYWHKLNAAGRAGPLEAYSISAAAAFAGKFAPPSKDPGSPLMLSNYAYHFDAVAYAALLRAEAEKRGVTRMEGKAAHVRVDAETGYIEGLDLDDGRAIDADFFVDCTGFRSLLIGDALDVPFEDWSHWLACDRAVAVQCETRRPLKAYTVSTATEAGWRWRIPLQSRVGNGHVYASDAMSDDAARENLLANIEGPTITEPRILRFKAGRRQVAWKGNCVSVGLSGGFLEPLESTSIHLIHLAISRLIELFPAGGIQEENVAKFNLDVNNLYESIRDFLILHYKLTERDDSAFWRSRREMDIPDSLQRKLDLYRAGARLFRENDEMFEPASWLAVMTGQGFLPDDYHPLADAAPVEETAAKAAQIAQFIDQYAAQMPRLPDMLEKAGCKVDAPA